MFYSSLYVCSYLYMVLNEKKYFYCFQFVSNKKQKGLFWFTFGQSKHTKLLIFNGVIN